MTTTNDEIHNAILALKSRLDVIEGKVTVIARANRPELRVELEKVVKKNPIVGHIYLALDGRKNQDQIVEELKSSAPTVSRWLNTMSREHGLVEVAKGEGASKVYRHAREMESVLHLTAAIRKWLDQVEKPQAKKAGEKRAGK
jgi:DNA-binding transcriptional ArsR family regulator